MSSAKPAQAQQVSKVELPAWVDAASQENYQLAKDVSGRPLQQYEGQRVADPSAMTTQGYGLIQSSLGQNRPTYDAAENIYKSTSGQIDPTSYLNPYINEVENRAIANANTSLDQQLRGVDARATAAKAFGGSRSAIENAVTRAEGVRGIGDLSASLRKAGFDTATSTALADRSGRQASAAGLIGTANARGASNLQDVTSLLSGGGQEQAQRQRMIDADMGKFQEKWNYPIEQLNMRLAALGMSPYGKTETGSKTSTAESLGTDWATLGLGVLKTIPSLVAMSDRNTKTDITKLTDGDIPLYSYRYKGDPKTYPKVVGPMAQDIEKKFPSAVKKVGKYKTVDLSNLMEVLS